MDKAGLEEMRKRRVRSDEQLLSGLRSFTEVFELQAMPRLPLDVGKRLRERLARLDAAFVKRLG